MRRQSVRDPGGRGTSGRPPAGWPYKNFCEKGGRFGPHNVNQEIHLPDVEKPGNLIYLTYFNAGLRVFDIKDPIQPEETGWFIPPQPTHRLGPQPPDERAVQLVAGCAAASVAMRGLADVPAVAAPLAVTD